MKKISLLAFTTLCLLLQSCNTGNLSKLSVSMDKTEATISTIKTAELNFATTNAIGNVIAELSQYADEIKVESSYDKASGKGTLKLSTSKKNEVHYEIPLVFKDEKNTVEIKIKVNIEPTWIIEPEEPETGAE